MPTDRIGRRRPLFARRRVRSAIVLTGLTGTLAVAGFGYAGMAVAAAVGVSPDDSRATTADGNFTDHQCPAGETDLVDSNGQGNDGTYSANGVTVVVSHLANDTADPFFTGGGPKALTPGTLPAGTQVLNVTLPAGTKLTGDILVMGGGGYNDYPGTALTLLIPPINNGGEIAALSHFVLCGALSPTTGSISVTKHVSGTGPGSNGTFDVEVKCDNGGPDTTLTLSDGQTKTVDSIPDGSTCTVTETSTGGADTISYSVNSAASSSTAPSIVVHAGDSDTVDVTNTYVPGSLKVTKAVTGPNAPAAGTTFPVTVNCGSGPVNFDLADGGSHTITGLAGGTQCTVTETDSHGGVVSYVVDAGASGSSAPTVTIHDNTETDVAITNDFPAVAAAPGSMQLTKTLSGAPPAGIGPFSFSLNCGGAVTPISITPGTPVTVPAAAGSCTLTETDALGATSTTFNVNGAGAVAGSSATFTVASNATTPVVVDNNFAGASLTVTKAVTGTSPTTTGFVVDVNCGTAGDFPGITLNAGDSDTVTSLPGGSVCTVTETNAQGAQSTTYTVGASTGTTPPRVPLGIGGSATVTITNNYPIVIGPGAGGGGTPPGSLTVNKIVDGTGTGSSGPFTVTADCGTNGTFTFSGLVGGASQTQSVPAGATCTVTETDANGATSTTYQVGSATPTSSAPSVGIVSGATTTVTVTNVFVTTAPSGSLGIQKSVDKHVANYGDNLVYTLDVTAGAADEHNVTVTDVVPTNTTFVSASCPAPCTVSGPTSGGVVTWDVGTLAAGTSTELTMVVNITKNGVDTSQQERIVNAAVASSNEHPNVPSNKVHTRVGAVQPVAVVRHHHKQAVQAETLPFTGFDAQQYGMLAVLLVGIGAAMSIVARRRTPIAPVQGARFTQSQLERLHRRQAGRHRR